ncbi:MAG TPA: Maf family nucleotide pyrophosphatase [Burkholderiales bacterium]|jgi:septum formation protein|nr:Maf family nucleotide pyrophosphatase [Burkholderiales bacterium]
MPSAAPAASLVLASTSRYRRELLERLSLAFLVEGPGTDETPLPDEPAVETAARLALAKARAVGARHPGALVIGADQVAVCDGVRLDKPGTLEKAIGQLRHASGRVVTFHTALVLLNTASGRHQAEAVPTESRFRHLSEAEIQRYLRAEPALDCAGSAKAEGLGIALMEEIRSADPTALIGLPLIALARMLRAEGVAVP